MSSWFAESFLGDHYKFMKKAAEAAWERQKIIASNIANASNPNYVAQDINFEEQFKEILAEKFGPKDEFDIHLETEDPRHISDEIDLASYEPEPEATGKPVDLQEELGKLLENQMRYQILIKGATGPLKGISELLDKF